MNLAAEYAYRALPADPDAKTHRDNLAAALAPTTRTCHCGSPIQRRADEAWNRYQRRTCCSTSCASSVRAKEAAATKRAQRIEDLEWIIGTCPAEEVAKRLGYGHLDSLITTLNRWDRPDLLERLRRTRRDVA